LGLEDVLDRHCHVARNLEVPVDLELRVDHRGDSRVVVADELGGAAEVVVGLAEDQRVRRGRVARAGNRVATGSSLDWNP